MPFLLLHFSTLWGVVSTAHISHCAKWFLTYNLDNELWPVIRTGWDVLDFPQREHSIDHFTEDYVFPV